ncbi:MAG: site-specific DNA-methyltransferase [Sulfobacillus acidophilus]|uniref:Site-specific DNA-methyltransferase n=1 Tax=Sulfobacillus acidophilus TaxID=53633 RepID=A0A2T2WE66_9FIRM|nr:MAG: site-specific DNA-methyltransferase [Sulfobacillus acidophilus]
MNTSEFSPHQDKIGQLAGFSLAFAIEDDNLRVAQAAVHDQIRWLAANEFPHRFKLVYFDPPFFSNKDYGTFSDEWTSLQAYLDKISGWVEQAARWMTDDGFLVLHCDFHASHYLKVRGDQIFGYDNFRNEWIWHYGGRRQPAILHVNSKHDVLLVWAKSPQSRFNAVFEPWDRDSYVAMKRQTVHVDEDGREWIWGHQGRGRPHAYRIYLDEHVRRGRAIDSVWDIPIINTTAKERVGYPTQKPLKLMDRIIELTTNPGDWVADFAAGSGTTGVAALKAGRLAWLGDQSEEAVRVMVRRLAQKMLIASGAVDPS